jgi:predicted AlkP superfamily phosphohydrolase/phosphomutase
MSTPKVFVLGLDGATFDLILPWAREGKLPNFSRLLSEGSWGPLESVPNMRSAAAWTSFMTGKNPGKHGIYEFYEPAPHSYGVRFIHGGMRHGYALWGILSKEGKRVGVINVPMTYPAESVNGFLIAGLDAPGPESPGFCHPQNLLDELQKRFGTYILEPGLTGCLVGGKVDEAIYKLQAEMRQKEEIIAFLMSEYAWDFFTVVFRSLDAVQHCFWRYMDPLHPHYDRENGKLYGSVILSVYQEIDRILGAIWRSLGSDAVLMVMSDHGFGRKHPANAQLNLWLADRGFLHYVEQEQKNRIEEFYTRLIRDFYRFFLGKTSRRIKETFARRFPQLRNKIQSKLCFANIDWSRTKCYSDSLFPNIRINVKDREPQGTVKAGKEYWEVVTALRQALRECRDKESGEPIVDRVFHRDEIYSGPFVEKAPDLLIRWREDLEIHGLDLQDPKMNIDSVLERSRPLVPGEDPNIISGDHRVHGILLMAGKPIRKSTRLSHSKIIDLAPTILHLLGLFIPSDMDGHVLTDALHADLTSPNTAFRIDGSNEIPESHQETIYSVEEKEAIAKRLRDLGYIE